MKIITQIIIIVACSVAISAQTKKDARFEDYKVSVYKGKTRLPKWITKVSENEWRDKFGKMVAPPDINFAGKYFVAVHSCGMGCRYYTMTDMKSGRELKLLDSFTTAETPPKTADGRDYLSILYYQYDSNLMIVQYLVDYHGLNERCRERNFLFDKGKLRPISKIKYKCRKF